MTQLTVTPKHSPVIVFDEDCRLQESMVNCLAMDGFEASGASSPEDFFRELELHPDLLAVINVDTAAYDGLDMIGFVRKKSDARIIALTTSSSPSHRLACIKAGADVCLLKPVNFMLLSASVGVLLLGNGRDETMLDINQFVS
ncbi:MAG: response regulator [Chlorobiaceae bacterium]